MKANQRLLSFFTPVLALLLLSGCAETELASHYAKKLPWGKEHPEGKQGAAQVGTYKVGTPYKVGSVWYYPEENFRFSETGIASWYGPNFHGKHTANGEVYDQHALTAAHRTLQMPSFVRVTNLENGRNVIVRVNDRGPYKHGRVIDVSKQAAELLGFANKGTARVRLEVLEQESRKISSIARRGVNTTGMTVADLDRAPETYAAVQPAAAPPPTQAQPAPRAPQFAMMSHGGDQLPESLQTPTITVEEINAPGRAAPPSRARRGMQPAAYAPPPAPAYAPSGVSAAPMRATALYVQAGAFSVRANAEKLKDSLAWIAPAHIEPVTVKGRQFYRVKLGPVDTVSHADTVLAKVIDSGQHGAKIIKLR